MKKSFSFIKNELITEKELINFGITPTPSRFEIVNLPKNKVFTMFGVRMEVK